MTLRCLFKMRFRSIPYIGSLAVLLFIYCFPLLEFDINWNYVDWNTDISQRSGSNVIYTTMKFDYPRVPGIEPTWSFAHDHVRRELRAINASVLPEYAYTWYYKDASGVDSVDQSFMVSDGVGGYIAILYPRGMNLSSSYRSVCTISNMDSVFGSTGFTSNALGLTQSLLALEELARTPGLVNPITLVILESKENGANMLVNMYSLPELEKCAYSIVLDSLGIAKTVPEAIHLTELSGSVLSFLPRTVKYLRTSNYILDIARALSLLSTSEMKLLDKNSVNSSISKIDYVDNQFRFHSAGDNSDAVNAAAVKARYDRIVEMNRVLSQVDPSSIKGSTTYLDYASYISVWGFTIRVSSLSQFFMVLIGLACSIIFIRWGNMGNVTAVKSGIARAGFILALQFVVLCLTVCFVLLWFSLDPLVTHKINPYIFSLLLTLLITAFVQFTLQICFYTQFFIRDHAGSMIAFLSIVYGVIALGCILGGLTTSLNFAFPCLCFGLTQLPLFFRKVRFGDGYRVKKITYSIFLGICGVLTFLVNMGSACATLHVVFGMMSTRDLSVNIILVYAFWNAIFPALFCAACTTVIYVFDGHPLETSSTMYSPLLPPDGVKAEELTMEKIVVRSFLRWSSGFILCLVLLIATCSSQLSAWNSENPVSITVGITYSKNHYELNSAEEDPLGVLMMAGKTSSLRPIKQLLQMIHLQDGYRIKDFVDTTCYLENNRLGPCVQVQLLHNEKPVEFHLNQTTFSMSRIVPKGPTVRAGNFTYYWRDFDIVIPERNNVSLFGYPLVHFTIYTTTQHEQDSKLYSNAVELIVNHKGVTSHQRGFSLKGVIFTNGRRQITIPVRVKSRVGSQVVFRIMDVSHDQPKEIQILQKGLGEGFVFGSNSDLTSYSFANTYFFSY